MSVIAGFAENVENGKEIFNSNVFDFFTPRSAYAFMVFNLFSAPCFGAIGAIKKEIGSTKKMLMVVAFQIIFAWCLAVLINQLGVNLLAIIAIIFVIVETAKKTRKSKQKTKRGCQYCPYCKDCENML